MIGTPPSARFPATSIDPPEDALRSAHDWADVGETYFQERLRQLGIPGWQVRVR
jgi:hypothetical protein